MITWLQNHKRFVVIISSLLCILLFMGICLVRGPRKLAAFKDDMIARGEVIDLSKLIANHPVAKENAAAQLDAGVNMLGSVIGFFDVYTPMKLVAPGKAQISWQQKEEIEADKKKYSWSDGQKQLVERRKQLDQLSPVLALPHLDRYLEYERGFGVLLPHLSRSKSTVNWFRLAVACQLRQSNLEGALADICNLFRFIRLQSEEKMIISQLVYIAEFHMALATLWEALQMDGWNDSQLELIQKELDHFHFYESMKQALILERAMAIKEYTKFRHSKTYSDSMMMGAFGMGSGTGGNSMSTGNPSVWSDFSQFFDAIGGWMKSAGLRTAGTVRHWYWRFFVSHDDEIQYLKYQNYTIQQIDEALKGKKLCDITAQTEQWMTAHQKNMSKMMLSAIMMGGQSSYIEKAGISETMLQMAIISLALKRYQIQNKHLPENLSPLVPAFLKQIPLDTMDGKPLRYRINSEGRMLLYSVGKDGVDNGGDPSLSDNQKNKSITNGKDWVWPEPVFGPEQ